MKLIDYYYYSYYFIDCTLIIILDFQFILSNGWLKLIS